MVNIRCTIIAILLISTSFAHAGNGKVEQRLRWWLQQPESRGDVFYQGRLDGIDYRKLLRGAVAYDRESLVVLFRYTSNGRLIGEGADTNCEILHLLLQHWGDARFATVLSEQPKRIRTQVLSNISYAWNYPGWQPTEFPRTYRLGPPNRISALPK